MSTYHVPGYGLPFDDAERRTRALRAVLTCSNDVLESLETGRTTAIEAMRQFIDPGDPGDRRSVAAQGHHGCCAEFG